MAGLKVVEQIAGPVEAVFEVLRDEVEAVCAELPNINRAEAREREDQEDGLVRTVTAFYASAEIPKLAQGVVKPEMLRWTDDVVWDASTHTSRWCLKVDAFGERVKCQGVNTLRDIDGKKTELSVDGELSVNLVGLRGVPRLLAGQLGAMAEKIVAALIAPNYGQLSRGVEKVLSKR